MTPPLAPLIGFRLGPLVPVDHVAYGQVFIETPGEPWVTQGTARAGMEVDRFGIELSGAWVATGGHELQDVALGRLRVTSGVWIGRGRPVFLGLELAASPFVDVDRSALAWGTRARDILPGTDGLLVASYAHPGGHIGGRIAVGISDRRGWGSYPPLAGDVTLVVQSAPAGRWAAVGEVDLCADPTFLTLRPMARYASAQGLQMDVGLQLPFPALAHTVTLQPVVQLRWVAPTNEVP